MSKLERNLLLMIKSRHEERKNSFSQARGVVGASLSNAWIVPDFDRLTDTVRAMCVHQERESTGSTNGEFQTRYMQNIQEKLFLLQIIKEQALINL